MENRIVVVGIGTDVGKTVVYSILIESLKAYYWKPIQAGDLDFSDSNKVARLAPSNKGIIKELYRLNTPASPHYAAFLDGISIQQEELKLPTLDVGSNLVIESAGGLMVPINSESLLYIDVIKSWGLPVVLVSRHYLGSINHTLLSLELLKQKEISVQLLVFVGDENLGTEEIILHHHPYLKAIRIPFTENLDVNFIQEQAKRFLEFGC